MSNVISQDELQSVIDRLYYDDDINERCMVNNHLEGHTHGCINGIMNTKRNENLITLNLLTLEHILEKYKKPEMSSSSSMFNKTLKVENKLQVDCRVTLKRAKCSWT